MAVYDNTHSRIVAWLKVILPLAALVLLSTMFLVSQRIMPDDSLPYARVDIEKLAREQRLTAPRYSGMTDDGAAVTVRADIAHPEIAASSPDGAGPEGTDSGASAEGLKARLETADGTVTTLASSKGSLDPAGQNMTLEGDVRIDTSDGLKLRTDDLKGALDRTSLSAPGEITGEMPLGSLKAGSMEMTGEKGSYRAVFNQGVKMVYIPRHPATAAAGSEAGTEQTGSDTAAPGASATGAADQGSGSDGQTEPAQETGATDEK